MVAMWLLGTLAAAQVVAVGWAVVTFPKNGAAAASGTTAGAGSDVAGGARVEGVVRIAADGSTVVAEAVGALPNRDTAGVAEAGMNPAMAMTALGLTEPSLVLPGPALYPTSDAINGAAGISNPAHDISHPVARRMLAMALEYRASGNMQAALLSLKDANTLSPNHPRVLSEIASTYSQMSLDDKAAEYWRSVYVLGPERAGAFYDLADMALKGNLLEDTAPVVPVLSLGKIETLQHQALPEGERVKVRIPVQSRPGTVPNAADMAMLVYFYDQVNGTDAAPTTADTAEIFVSQPYDWQESGLEIIEETYFQPTFTDAQKKELGDRKYYGYIIELYYRDELQDVVAEPSELMGLKPGQPQQEQLPDPGAEFGGAGSELFPDN